ncbi:MAG TPA: glycosyltransferase [Puia sp.]|jgi:glycosyltransferase involved in cell wall biosynthesis/GT2 family glycosyltransferase
MFPKVGIVIVSYNASPAVRITLASLRRARNMTLSKVILIDNASEKSERANIRNAFDKHVLKGQENWSYIQLSRNLGFAGGNNVGIKMFLKDADITHICLLNSDVILSDFWLDRLVAKQSQIVSPVTNKAYSEQCVPVSYQIDLGACLDWENDIMPDHCFNTINDFSQNWYRTWRGNMVRSDVTFFCVLLTRGLVEKIGLLDEKFFPGGYEDDDYCERVNAEGVEIHLARDIFMHHFGSASFGQLQQQYFNQKASKNKEYLEKKYNFIWKRRPEKPITSYGQDILYALRGKGNHELQLHYHKLYAETLTQLINHVENEFSAIYHHLIHCGHPIPDALMDNAKKAVAYGDIAALWAELLREVDKGLHGVPCDELLIQKIDQNLEKLTDAVYAKAEANLAMVDYLREIGVFGGGLSPIARKPLLQKIKWLLQRGLSFLWNLKGIVFFGGYPYPEREKDGYFQRIRSIDDLVQGKWRIYVDHYRLPGKDSWYDRPEPNVLVLHMNNHRYRWFMRMLVTLCVLRSRKIYFHSVLRMQDSKFGRFMRWPGITRVIDIHGVVPEEFRMHNDFFSARIYDAHEEIAVKKADHIIVVTEAMKQYFRQKYQDISFESKVIVLPIFPNISSSGQEKPYVNGFPVVIYAGGTHKWQQVPKMVDAIIATKDFCIHKFFCPHPGEVTVLFPESLRHHPHIIIDSKPFKELLGIYEQCHYGFILREDIIVNHAACPTKLVEYVAMRIVPIVDCEKMGDFVSLGMQFLRLKDFLAGNLPDEQERNRMAETNYTVYTKLQDINHTGKEILRPILTQNGIVSTTPLWKRLILKTRHKVGVTLTPASVPGRLMRRVWWAAKRLRNEPKKKRYVNELIAEAVTLPHIVSCDILLQVDNFMVGGLENAVLDQLHTFKNAGMSVALLVLGEAGTAARRALNDDIPVCITPYHAGTYLGLLRKAAPKIIISHYSIRGTGISSQLGIPFIQVIQNTYMWFTAEEAYQFSKAAKQTAAFIAVSDYAKKYSLARLGVPKESCFVIPNSIDLSPFKKIDREGARLSLRKIHGLSDDNFVFLSVGSINHQKNHICSVRAFHLALKDMPEAKLLILGKLYEPQLWNEILDYIKSHHLEDQIIYAGESENPPAYYFMADAFVHSAFFEGGPLSLLEAISANLPIITTNVGFSEHFRGKKGFSVVLPPVDIIDYYGPIWELKSTHACENNIALEMVKVFKTRTRPDLSESVIEMFDRHHTYRLYIDFINRYVKTGEFRVDTSVDYWPSLILNGENIYSSGLSIEKKSSFETVSQVEGAS